MYQIVPVLGVLAGIIIPVSVFIWLYFEGKDKNKTIVEIAKHLNDPSKVDEFLQILDERKKEPIDYRRGRCDHCFCWDWYLHSRLCINGKLFWRYWTIGCHYWYRQYASRISLPKYKRGTNHRSWKVWRKIRM